MTDGKYQVIYFGSAARDSDLSCKLVKNLQVRLGLSHESAIHLMWSGPITIYKGISLSQAQWMKVVLEDMGASVRIEPMDAAGNQPNIEASGQVPVVEQRPKTVSERERRGVIVLKKARIPWQIIHGLYSE